MHISESSQILEYGVVVHYTMQRSIEMKMKHVNNSMPISRAVKDIIMVVKHQSNMKYGIKKHAKEMQHYKTWWTK